MARRTMSDVYDFNRKVEAALPASASEWYTKHRFYVAAALADGLGVRRVQVNDTINWTPGRGGGRRMIIVHTAGTVFLAMPLSGNGKGERGEHSNYSMAMQFVAVPPTWVGANAEKLYKQYVEQMTAFKHTDIIAPFCTAIAAPEPERERPTAVASDADPDVVITHSPETGTVAAFERNADLFKVLRHWGFLWVPSQKIVRRASSVGTPEPTISLSQLKRALNDAGFKVAFDVTVAETREELEAAAEAKRAHFLGRAEMAEDRAERLHSKAGSTGRAVERAAEEAAATVPITGYHPTPAAIARRMAALLEAEEGDQVLEPSAGGGVLVEALRAQSGNVDGTFWKGTVDAVEQAHPLQELLRRKRIAVVSSDIMTFDPGTFYDGAIMNPPFEDGQDAQHVVKVFTLLRPGGRLVALMSEGPFFRQHKRDAAFRAWLDGEPDENVETPDVILNEKLGMVDFGGGTKVNVRILVLDKPEDAAEREADPAVLEDIVAARERASVPTPSAEGLAAGRRAAVSMMLGGLIGRAHAALEGIPMGQPIQPGRRGQAHRRAIERADALMRKATEMAKKAGRAEELAASRRAAAAGVVTPERRETIERTAEFNAAVAAKFVRLKAAIGVGRITTGYVGTGQRAMERIVNFTLADGTWMDAVFHRDGVVIHKHDAVSRRAAPSVSVQWLQEDTPDTAFARVVEAMQPYAAERKLSWSEEFKKLVRGRAKRDTGAAFVKSDPNYRDIILGYGEVTEGWYGKRGAQQRHVDVNVWRDGSKTTVTVDRRHQPMYGDTTAPFVLDVTAMTPEAAWAAAAAWIREDLISHPTAE